MSVDDRARTTAEDTALAGDRAHRLPSARWLIGALVAVLALAAIALVVWANTVSALVNAGSSGLRSSQPLVTFANAERHQSFAMFADGAKMTVITDLRNEAPVPITITELFVDAEPGTCTYRTDRVRIADANDPRLPFSELGGDLVLGPDEVVLVQADLTMACSRYPRGATRSYGAMLATYRIGPFSREQEVNLAADFGWANYRNPRQFIDANVAIE